MTTTSLRLLKADLHTHTAEDPKDKITYGAEELILKAAGQGFEVLAITNHQCLTFDQDLFSLARDHGLLLIPGMEVKIQNRHVLILNPPEGKTLECFSDLAALNRPDCLVIAPHPYYPGFHSLNGYLTRHLEFFQALEYCHFYTTHLNFNRRAMRLSQTSGLPLVGTSDAHFLDQLGTTYSLIQAEKDMESIFSAIRRGKVKVVTRPLTLFRVAGIMGRFFCWRLLGRPCRTSPAK
jgi:predicted metal-dependent phosphoesterase TrpH